MISEKDKKIVAAVFATKGAFPHDEDEEMSQIIMAKREFDGYSVGEFQGGNSVRTNEYWEFICTIEEYNQCMEDMSRAGWMTDWIGYLTYKTAMDMKGIDTSNKELLKENCDYSFYDKPLVYTRDDFDYQRPIIDGMQFRKVGSGSRIEVALLVTDCEVCHKNKDDLLVITPIKDVRPIKTPEQIKQDKLDAQAEEIAEKHCRLFNDLNATIIMFIAVLQKDGYMVEPK